MTDELTILLGDLDVSPASTAALGLCRWAEEEGMTVDVVSTWGGPRRPAFEQVAAVHVVNDDVGWDSRRVLASLDLPRPEGAGSPATAPRRRRLPPARAAVRALGAIGLGRGAEAIRSTDLRRVLRHDRVPVIAFGARSARLVHYLPTERPLVAVLPAGETLPTTGEEAADLRLVARRAERLVIGEEALRPGAEALGPTGPVDVLPDLMVTDPGPGRAAVRAALASRGIAPEAPLVASVGTFDWWDQPDGFVTVAWHLARIRPDLEVVWAAGESTDRMLWPLRHDLAHAGLDRVAITGTDPSPLAVLGAADVIVLARRGEVPPWVLTEIRTVGVPVVRWGRDPEEPLGRGEGEIVVAPLDDVALAEAVVTALDDPTVGPEVIAAARAARRRHGPEEVAPALLGRARPR